jgi:hypothetical protein
LILDRGPRTDRDPLEDSRRLEHSGIVVADPDRFGASDRCVEDAPEKLVEHIFPGWKVLGKLI